MSDELQDALREVRERTEELAEVREYQAASVAAKKVARDDVDVMVSQLDEARSQVAIWATKEEERRHALEHAERTLLDVVLEQDEGSEHEHT